MTLLLKTLEQGLELSQLRRGGAGGTEITYQTNLDDGTRRLAGAGQSIRADGLLLDPALAYLDSAVRCAGAVVDDEMVGQVLATLELM